MTRSCRYEPDLNATYRELAHAYLGHGQPVSDLNVAKNNEMEADRQVIRWGFEKELKASPHNYLFGSGIVNVF